MFNNKTMYWIAIDIANQAGHDKLTFEERIKFVEYYMKPKEGYHSPLRSFYMDTQDTTEILSKVYELQNSLDGRYLTIDSKELNFSSVDSPWGLKNAVHALYKYIDEGYANHMVYLDASNQALQLYGVLTRDRKTASTCNLANGSGMADAYQMLADALNTELNTTFTRKNCKKALMTTMYSKMDAWTEILEDRYPSGDFELQLKNEFNVEVDDLAFAFNRALITIAPKAMLAMESLLELNVSTIGTYYWTMPDGFKVKYDTKTKQSVDIDLKTKYGMQFYTTFSGRTYSPSEGNRGMAPNVVHSVDGYIVREMQRRMNGKFITTIHDAFACHPMDCDLMVQNYKDILIELLESDLLNNIISQIKGTASDFKYTNDLSKEDIQNSVYLLS